ncbi:40S ribosomal protein S20-like [Melanaphis sacchari]|uniref:40S ribosomal protein S20-like n=1 Tax=Melanaphis sacchari TaxID=742174 RepID=UPI000DC152B6|nr:40S ribosomal protein S20-like [Melanaphis sacchari]
MDSELKGVENTPTEQKKHNIRITLTSNNLKNLEIVCTAMITNIKHKKLPVKGPVRMPTKVMRITTRKTSCGEGSKTWDKFQMQIHKRVIDFKCQSDKIKQVININLEPYVFAEVSIANK